MGIVLKFFFNLFLFPIALCAAAVCFCVWGVLRVIIAIICAVELFAKAIGCILRHVWSSISVPLSFANTIIRTGASKIRQCLTAFFNSIKFAGKSVALVLSRILGGIYIAGAFIGGVMDALGYLIVILFVLGFLITNPWALVLLLFLH